MKQRCLTGAIIGVVFIALLLLSGTIIFNIVMALLCAGAAFEILSCTKQLGRGIVSIPSILFCFAVPFVARLSYGYISIFVVVLMFWCFFVSVFTNDHINTQSISVTFACTMYVGVCFYSLTKIRYVEQNGLLLLILVFVGAWSTDVFAYFTGRFFGKHKLIPKISPKKTVEGAVGGALCCAASYLLFGFITQIALQRTPSYAVIFIIGIIVSIIAQLGDLTMSAIKRNYGIKDYGTIFPGHGGVLDRFDSILAIAPFLMIVAGNPDFIAVFK